MGNALLFHLLAMLLVLVGAIAWGIMGVYDVDVIARALATFPEVTTRVAYAAIGIAGVYLAIGRDNWLPFLSKTAFPCAPLSEKMPSDAQAAYSVQTGVPHANVVYWAAESASEVANDPWMAYGTYSNSGVARTDENGVAVLRVRRPGRYRAPGTGVQDGHVHYRVCRHPGMLSEVQTVAVP
jgi:uncharacterized protein